MKKTWKYLNTVTTVSKIIATVLFVGLPFIGFSIGYDYGVAFEKNNQMQAQTVEESEVATPEATLEVTPTPTVALSNNKISLVKELDDFEFCEGLELIGNLPDNTITTSLLDTDVETCLHQSFQNDNFEIDIYIGGAGMGCLDISGSVYIGKLANSENIHRNTSINEKTGLEYYTYHILRDNEQEQECSATTSLADLSRFGNISVGCTKGVEICDEVVKSLEINAEMNPSYD